MRQSPRLALKLLPGMVLVLLLAGSTALRAQEWSEVPDGAIDFANKRFVVGWAATPQGQPVAQVQLRSAGCEAITVLPSIPRGDVAPHILQSVSCGFYFAVPDELTEGRHRVEVLARCNTSHEWTSLASSYVTGDDEPAVGHLEFIDAAPAPFFDTGVVVTLRAWAFDPDVAPADEGGIVPVVVEYEGTKVHEDELPNVSALVRFGFEAYTPLRFHLPSFDRSQGLMAPLAPLWPLWRVGNGHPCPWCPPSPQCPS